MKIRPARHADLPAIQALLAAAGLPESDIGSHLATLFVGERRGAIVAAGALEPLGADCLLRSIVVAEAWRGCGWGTCMTKHLLDFARCIGIREAYLLTTGAGEFFARYGFATTHRDTVPELMRRTRQFSELCPSTAQFMRLRLDSSGRDQPLTAETQGKT